MRRHLILAAIVLVPMLQGAAGEVLVSFEWIDSYFWVEPPVFREGAAQPELALYESGLLVYFTEDRRGRRTGAKAVRLTPSETEEFISELEDVGFDTLRAHPDRWFRGTIVTDQRTSVIRLRRGGEVIEKRNYGDWSETPDALRRTREFLVDYEHPRATPYRADGATVTVRQLDPGTFRQRPEWHPLPDSLRPPCDEAETWRVGLRGRELRSLESVLGTNAGIVYSWHEAQRYALRLEPWLPRESGTTGIEVIAPEGACIGALQDTVPTHRHAPSAREPGRTQPERTTASTTILTTPPDNAVAVLLPATPLVTAEGSAPAPGTRGAVPQETPSAPFLDRSSGTWVLRGTPAIDDALARELPDFVPWGIRDYVPDAVYWYGAVAGSFSERQAMFAAIGDFNADGVADVAIDGRTATERLLVFVLSDGPGYETLVLERTPLEERYDRRSIFLRLLPRGSALQCLEGDLALPSNRVTLAADAVEVDTFEKGAHAWYFEAGEFRSCITAD